MKKCKFDKRKVAGVLGLSIVVAGVVGPSAVDANFFDWLTFIFFGEDSSEKKLCESIEEKFGKKVGKTVTGEFKEWLESAREIFGSLSQNFFETIRKVVKKKKVSGYKFCVKIKDGFVDEGSDCYESVIAGLVEKLQSINGGSLVGEGCWLYKKLDEEGKIYELEYISIDEIVKRIIDLSEKIAASEDKEKEVGKLVEFCNRVNFGSPGMPEKVRRMVGFLIPGQLLDCTWGACPRELMEDYLKRLSDYVTDHRKAGDVDERVLVYMEDQINAAQFFKEVLIEKKGEEVLTCEVLPDFLKNPYSLEKELSGYSKEVFSAEAMLGEEVFFRNLSFDKLRRCVLNLDEDNNKKKFKQEIKNYTAKYGRTSESEYKNLLLSTSKKCVRKIGNKQYTCDDDVAKKRIIDGKRDFVRKFECIQDSVEHIDSRFLRRLGKFAEGEKVSSFKCKLKIKEDCVMEGGVAIYGESLVRPLQLLVNGTEGFFVSKKIDAKTCEISFMTLADFVREEMRLIKEATDAEGVEKLGLFNGMVSTVIGNDNELLIHIYNILAFGNVITCTWIRNDQKIVDEALQKLICYIDECEVRGDVDGEVLNYMKGQVAAVRVYRIWLLAQNKNCGDLNFDYNDQRMVSRGSMWKKLMGDMLRGDDLNKIINGSTEGESKLRIKKDDEGRIALAKNLLFCENFHELAPGKGDNECLRADAYSKIEHNCMLSNVLPTPQYLLL